MSTALPTARVKATRLSPKISIFYGMHKVGKTGKAVELEDCLILDTEGGSEMYDCMRVDISSANKVMQLAKTLLTEKAKLPPGKKFLYKYGVIDTIDKLEELAVAYLTWKWNHEETDPKKKIQSITDLDYGRGYGYVRDLVMTWVNGFAGAFEHLIILGHVRDKIISTKEGVEVTSKDLGLMGKMGIILCAAVDAIGYVYRALDGELRVNFKTSEINPTMGARFPYIAGKDLKFEWAAIFDPTYTENQLKALAAEEPAK